MTKAENTAAPAESTAPAVEPAVQPEDVPADPMAGDASEIENENSFPHFLTETEALAAEDPMAAPEEAAILPETEETAADPRGDPGGTGQRHAGRREHRPHLPDR